MCSLDGLWESFHKVCYIKSSHYMLNILQLSQLYLNKGKKKKKTWKGYEKKFEPLPPCFLTCQLSSGSAHQNQAEKENHRIQVLRIMQVMSPFFIFNLLLTTDFPQNSFPWPGFCLKLSLISLLPFTNPTTNLSPSPLQPGICPITQLKLSPRSLNLMA